MRKIALHAAILFPTESVMEAPDGDCNASVNTALVKAHHIFFGELVHYCTVPAVQHTSQNANQCKFSTDTEHECGGFKVGSLHTVT